MEVVYSHRSRSRPLSQHHHHHHSSVSSFSRSTSTKGSPHTHSNKLLPDEVSAAAETHPFAPQPEDYSAVFGSFLSGRACSIPMLDLPSSFLDDDNDEAATAGLDYSQVFGGLEFDRCGLTCDELFSVPECGGVEKSAADDDDESSSPARSESVSPDQSDSLSSVGSKQNQPYPLNRDWYQSPNRQCHTNGEVSHDQRVDNFGSVTESTDRVDRSDDIILREDSSGNVSVETLSCRNSSSSSSYSSRERNGKSGRGNGDCFMEPVMLSVSDVDVGQNNGSSVHTKPKHASVVNLEDDYNAYERIGESGLPRFFDVEVDLITRSSDRNSGEAANEKKSNRNAQVKIKTLKDLMKGKEDVKNSVNNNGSEHDNTRVVSGSDVRSSSSENVHDFIAARRTTSRSAATKKHARRRNVNKNYDFFGPGAAGDGKWKEESHYYELTNNNTREEPENRLANFEGDICNPFPANGIEKPRNSRLQGRGTSGGTRRRSYNSSQKVEEHEDSEVDECKYEPTRENQQDLKKAVGREFHDKVAQCINGNVENDNAAATLSSSVERKHEHTFMPAATVNKESDHGCNGVNSGKRIRNKVHSGEENGTTVDEECSPVRYENGSMINGASEMKGAGVAESGESQEDTAGLKATDTDKLKVDVLGSYNETDGKKIQEMKLQEKVSDEPRDVSDDSDEKQEDLVEPEKSSQLFSANHKYVAESQTVNVNESEICKEKGMENSSSKVAGDSIDHFKSVNLPSSSHDQKGTSKPEVFFREGDQTSRSNDAAANHQQRGKDTVVGLRSPPMGVEKDSKPPELVTSYSMPIQRAEAHEPTTTIPHRKEDTPFFSRRCQSFKTSQVVGISCSSILTPTEERVRAERLERARRAYEDEYHRKLEEEREREREREKDRMKVELEIAGGSRALAEARERAAVERATAEARERLEKACQEARGGLEARRGVSVAEKTTPYFDQAAAAAAARLRAERAAVERATAEARERALEKTKAERAAYEAREQLKTSVSDQFSGTRHYPISSHDARNCGGFEARETDQRCNARMQRHRRTVERVAEALAEKNKRDLIAQREQAERNRFAGSLNAEIKRWSNGKEGNLRALLSTLQHILGPDSGWQPIPLTEILTPAAAKRAYRKATLCVHPDKLQQRGANIQQKYICEKVFDLLKDAWNRFNSGEI